jgi:hypothetical protein
MTMKVFWCVFLVAFFHLCHERKCVNRDNMSHKKGPTEELCHHIHIKI